MFTQVLREQPRSAYITHRLLELLLVRSSGRLHLMNRSASRNNPQGSWTTVDDEPSRGSAVIFRVTALTSDLVYMLSRDAVDCRHAERFKFRPILRSWSIPFTKLFNIIDFGFMEQKQIKMNISRSTFAMGKEQFSCLALTYLTFILSQFLYDFSLILVQKFYSTVVLFNPSISLQKSWGLQMINSPRIKVI